MKKFILAAGLAGILVTGAMASDGFGTRTRSTNVTLDVATYMNITCITGGNFGFTVNDGGFAPTYSSGGYASFNATSNVTYNLKGEVTGTGAYSFLTMLDAGAFAACATSTGNSVGNGVQHYVDVELVGDTTNGLPPTPSTVTGTLTVSICQAV